MFLIKLGGSIITEKAQNACFRKKTMDALSKHIATADKKVILVHGAGSFGHGFAKKYSLKQGFTSEQQRDGFALTQYKVQQLNTFVLRSLQDCSLPAISIPPHASVMFKDNSLYWFHEELFKNYYNLGFIPVTFGDVVVDKTNGFSICSGDILMLALAETFKPDKVIFVLDEDGLYTANPKIDKDASFIDSISADNLKELKTTMDSHPDVTQGMAGKLDTIQKLAQLHLNTVLINGNHPRRLLDVLKGNQTKQTLIHWRK